MLESVGQWVISQAASDIGWWVLSVMGLIMLVLIPSLFGLLMYRARNEHTLQQLHSQADQIVESQNKLGEQEITHQENQQQLFELKKNLAVSQSSLEEKTARLNQTQEQLTTLQADLHASQTHYSELKARTTAERESLNEKLELLQDSRKQLTIEFENLANKIFTEKQKTFSDSSKQLLDGTLTPFKDQLQEFRKKVDDVYTAESKERHLLKDQITQLRAESLRISEDASNLTKALKSDNKAQGNWGELTLTRALEMCGLKEGQEYETQMACTNEAGKKQIPDVVVHLPGKKDIIIDSKVSLVAFTRYFTAKSEEEKQQAIKEHVLSVRSHIKELSKKEYENLASINTLDYVMLYIPIEGASAMALQGHPDLWEEAYSKNIVLVSPTNLLAILRSVETIWRHERQNKNAEKIALEAGRLYDQFVLYAQSLEETGKHLAKATLSHEKSVERLSSGRGNLLKRVENLKKLGAKTSKSMPTQLSDEAKLSSDEPLELSAMSALEETSEPLETES